MAELDVWTAIRGLKQQLDRLTSFEWPIYAQGTWVPTWTLLTIVGAPTYTGTYTRIGRIVFGEVTITAGGANTTASIYLTTFVNNLPFVPSSVTECFVYDGTTGVLTSGVVAAGGVFTPTWVASNATKSISFWYRV